MVGDALRTCHVASHPSRSFRELLVTNNGDRIRPKANTITLVVDKRGKSRVPLAPEWWSENEWRQQVVEGTAVRFQTWIHPF